MTRNLKALGLALVAMLVMGAMMASAAQAETTDPALFTAAEAGAEIKGEAIEGAHLFTVGENTVTCSEAKTKFSGTQTNAEETTITLVPTYEECHVTKLGGLVTLDVTVTMNECDFTFNATKTTKPPGTVIGYFADAGIKCPTGNVIEVHVYNGKNVTHNAEHSLCTITIPPTTGDPLKTIELTNTGTTKMDVTADINITNIPVHVHGPVETCGETNQTATYKGKATLRAFKGPNQIDGTVS